MISVTLVLVKPTSPVEKNAEAVGDLLGKLLEMTKEDVQNGLEKRCRSFPGRYLSRNGCSGI